MIPGILGRFCRPCQEDEEERKDEQGEQGEQEEEKGKLTPGGGEEVPQEAVVVSGMSGRLPESDDLAEFREHRKLTPGGGEEVPQEAVVVSGMSGRLPESDDLAEFREHLLKGDDMVTETSRRWRPGGERLLNVPPV